MKISWFRRDNDGILKQFHQEMLCVKKILLFELFYLLTFSMQSSNNFTP